jgi:putative FmdB family regulatory protein
VVLYRYQCDEHGNFEAFAEMDKRHEVDCPECGKRAQKLIDYGSGSLESQGIRHAKAQHWFKAGWYPHFGNPSEEAKRQFKWKGDKVWIGSMGQLRDVCEVTQHNSKYLMDSGRAVTKRRRDGNRPE